MTQQSKVDPGVKNLPTNYKFMYVEVYIDTEKHSPRCDKWVRITILFYYSNTE